MPNPENPESFPTQVFRMNARINGIITGIICGGGLWILTLWLVIKGGKVVGPHLGLLSQYFIGYSVTVKGAFIGLGYGFAIGFLTGYGASRIYNFMTRWRHPDGPRG